MKEIFSLSRRANDTNGNTRSIISRDQICSPIFLPFFLPVEQTWMEVEKERKKKMGQNRETECGRLFALRITWSVGDYHDGLIASQTGLSQTYKIYTELIISRQWTEKTSRFLPRPKSSLYSTRGREVRSILYLKGSFQKPENEQKRKRKGKKSFRKKDDI